MRNLLPLRPKRTYALFRLSTPDMSSSRTIQYNLKSNYSIPQVTFKATTVVAKLNSLENHCCRQLENLNDLTF